MSLLCCSAVSLPDLLCCKMNSRAVVSSCCSMQAGGRVPFAKKRCRPSPMWGAGLAIRYNDIYFERELGEGRYAKVYKANVYGATFASLFVI